MHNRVPYSQTQTHYCHCLNVRNTQTHCTYNKTLGFIERFVPYVKPRALKAQLNEQYDLNITLLLNITTTLILQDPKKKSLSKTSRLS